MNAEAIEQTITPNSRIPMGMAWAILTVMCGVAFLAGQANAKIDDAAAKSDKNGVDLKDFREEVKGEFREIKKTLDEMRERMQQMELSRAK